MAESCQRLARPERPLRRAERPGVAMLWEPGIGAACGPRDWLLE